MTDKIVLITGANEATCSETETRRVLVSSRGAGWNDLTLEQREAAPGGKDQPPLPVHIVCLNLGEQCDLWQKRDGRTRRHVQPYGDAVLMPAGCASHWRWMTPARNLYLQIAPELIFRTAAEIGSRVPELTHSFGASDPRLLHLGLALKEEAQTGGGNGLLFAQCLSTAVAAHLLAHYASAPPTVLSAHGLSASQMKRVTDHIKDHLHSGLSLAEIAETVHISPFHFARQFKRAMGKTLHEFVLECRVDAAKRLLRRPELSVGQVASQAGFSQQSHLAAHFRRVTGLSPAAFRRQFSS